MDRTQVSTLIKGEDQEQAENQNKKPQGTERNKEEMSKSVAHSLYLQCAVGRIEHKTVFFYDITKITGQFISIHELYKEEIE